MKDPKTIRGYLSLIREIELMCPTTMDGFDKLSRDDQDNIKELSAAISNITSEISMLNRQHN